MKLLYAIGEPVTAVLLNIILIPAILLSLVLGVADIARFIRMHSM